MNTEEIKGSASGLIVLPPKPSDYRLGGYTSIVPEVRTKDWTKYQPENEKQYGPISATAGENENFDSLSCASFATMHAIETQVNFLLSTNAISESQRIILLRHGFLDNKESVRCKLSVRFLAITSKTTKNGNDIASVAQAARTIGCIPDRDLPFGGYSFEQYQGATITEEMLAKGKIFLEVFNIKYEWVFFDYDPLFSEENRVKSSEAILQAPLVIGVPLPAGHAILMTMFNESIFKVLDQYPPFTIDHSYAYPIHFAMKVLVTMMKPFTFENRLELNMRHPDVAMLQRTLNMSNDEKNRVAKYGVGSRGKETVFFGKMTELAVKKFQNRYGLPPVGIVGPQTRAALNKILAGESPRSAPSLLAQFSLKPKVERLASIFIEKCMQANLPIKITEGYRSPARQQELYNQSRTTPGKVLTNAKAGESFHNYGLAFDVCFTSGEPYAGRDTDYQKIAEIAVTLGFQWGGNWKNNLGDIVHFEYTGGYTIEQFLANNVDWNVFV